jgi:hypothetical protein
MSRDINVNKIEVRASDAQLNEAADEVGDSIILEFNKWIRPELAKIIGQEATDKIADADFEAVLKTQYSMLFIERSHTVRKNGAIFYFRLLQGIPGNAKLISKMEYKAEF